MAEGDADAVWMHLTPPTRRTSYGGDAEAFERDVAAVDWSELAWKFGPVVDYEISWGVYVTVEQGSVPSFLIDRGLVTGDDRSLVLLVQIPLDDGYWIAGQGMDTRVER